MIYNNKKLSNELKNKFFFVILFILFLIPNLSKAIDLEIPIAGRSSVTDLADYLVLIYNYIIYLAGVFAVIMIIVSGFQWVMAGGNESKISGAKERIKNAIIGLVLVSGSYLILNIINPDLVRVEKLKLETIDREEIYGDLSPSSLCLRKGGFVVPYGGSCECNPEGETEFYSITEGFSCCICFKCRINYTYLEEGISCYDYCNDKGCTGHYLHGSNCCSCSGCPGDGSTYMDSECIDAPLYTSCKIDEGVYKNFQGFCTVDKACSICKELGQECNDVMECKNYGTGINGCGISNIDSTVTCQAGWLGIGAKKCRDSDI